MNMDSNNDNENNDDNDNNDKNIDLDSENNMDNHNNISPKSLGGEQQKGWEFPLKEYEKIWKITGKKWKNMKNTQMKTFSLNRTDQNNFSSFRSKNPKPNPRSMWCHNPCWLRHRGSGPSMDMGCSA